MNRRYSIQMIPPKMIGPVAVMGGPPRRGPSKSGSPRPTSSLRKMAIRTGAATTRAMKIVRRDQSISPSERSKTRRLAVRKPGGRREVAFVI